MHNLTQAIKLVPSKSFNCLGFWIVAPSLFEISGYAPVLVNGSALVIKNLYDAVKTSWVTLEFHSFYRPKLYKCVA